MKKIISALTLGAVICGAAFADVTMNLAYRQRANMYAAYEGDAKYVCMLDNYSGSGTDNLAMSLSGDVASFDITLVGDEATTNNIRAKTLGANVFVGNLTLFGGFWADGKVNGAYRAKSDIDAGNLEGMDFEFKKLGSAFAGSPNNFMDNVVMPVQVTASESYALGGTYGIKMTDGAVNITGTYITNETSDEKGAKSSGSLQGHSGVALVDARKDGLGQAEFVFKYGQTAATDYDKTFAKSGNKTGDKKSYLNGMAFGLYAQPTITRNLILTVGGAGSVVDGEFTDYSADLRARYQIIPKKLSVTSFNSWSSIVGTDSDAALHVALLNGKKNATTKGIANNGYYTANTKTDGTGSDLIDAGKLGGTTLSRDQILSNNIMVRYNVNDKLSVFAIAADMIGMGQNAGVDVKEKDNTTTGTKPIVQLRFSGWAQFFANANCSATVGCVYAIHDVTETYQSQAYHTWGVPVIVRIKM